MEKWEKVEVAPTWNFKEENELIGTFMSAETEVGPNKSNLYNLKGEDGEMISVWGNTILDSRFKNISEGDRIRIVFTGKETSPKTGREYNNFEIFKSRTE